METEILVGIALRSLFLIGGCTLITLAIAGIVWELSRKE